jgi:hypothetical protein
MSNFLFTFAKAGLAAGLLLGSGCSAGGKFDDHKALCHEFSGEHALAMVAEIVALGPRPPGSEALEKSRVLLTEKLNQWGWRVRRHEFSAKTPEGARSFVNLRARFGKEDSEALWEKPARILLCSHYDTKIFAGFEFVGADDPGSSMGAVMEIARVVSGSPDLARSLELVFFDGEESFGPTITPKDGLYGSREYSRTILRRMPEGKRPRWGVLLDMVGDRDLNVRLPADSPRELVAHVFSAAEDLGYRQYFGIGSVSIIDDHIPLNAEGLPTVDIIDFDFKYWHTPGDTLDKLSPESLEIVGKTTLLMLEKYLR